MENEPQIFDLLAKAFTLKPSPYHRSTKLGDHPYNFGWREPNMPPAAIDVEWPRELIDIPNDNYVLVPAASRRGARPHFREWVPAIFRAGKVMKRYQQVEVPLSGLTLAIIDTRERYYREAMILSLARLLQKVVGRHRSPCFADNQDAMQRGALYLVKSDKIYMRDGCEAKRLENRVKDRRKVREITTNFAAVEERTARPRKSTRPWLTNPELKADARATESLWQKLDDEERIEEQVDRAFMRQLVQRKTPLDYAIENEEGTLRERLCVGPHDATVLELAEGDWTDAQIAAELGIDRRIVKKIIVRAGHGIEHHLDKKPRNHVQRRPGKPKPEEKPPEDKTWPSYHKKRAPGDPMPPTEGLFDEDGYKLKQLPRSFERPAGRPNRDEQAA